MSAYFSIPRLWRRLDVRLALVVMVVMMALGSTLVALQDHQMQRRQDALTQWQSLHLARYIADRQAVPMIDNRGVFRPKALADIAMYASMIQPSLEVYLLDAQGIVLDHGLPTSAPALNQVNLSAVQDLIHQTSPQLPIYGDDPNRPDKPNLVSLTPLPNSGQPLGYLYIVLRGEKANELQNQDLGSSHFFAAMGIGLLAIALASGVIVAAQTLITRRLRWLANDLTTFRQPDGLRLAVSGDRGDRGDEIDRVTDAAKDLQLRVHLQFKRLEDNDRLRRELVSNVSHDLHTPLANIQGYVETLLVRGKQFSPEIQETYLRTTLHHCQKMARRVAELFELSKLESGQTLAQLEPFCMAELLNDVVQHQQLTAQQAGISLKLSEHTDRCARVLADIGLIERVLQNLVDNALRHTSRGGWVELTVNVESDRVHVRINDNGCGITAQDLPHIFERYWTTRLTSDDAQQPSASGGLGLAIARLILELHGSTIGVRSDHQQGAEFSFALPRAA